VILAAILALHKFILAAIAGLLVVPELNRQPTVAAIHSGDRRYATAAAELQAGEIHRVLLFRRNPGRLQLMGVLPTDEQIGLRELSRGGVAGGAIEILASGHASDEDVLVSLDAWLKGQPSEVVGIYCSRFGSRRMDMLCHRLLAPTTRGRIVVVPLADRRFDESNWWKSRSGIKELFGSAFRLTYAWLRGVDRRSRPMLNAEQYESLVLAGRGNTESR
jgi:hypothetical protein